MTVQLTQEQFQELLGRISAIHSVANMNFTQCDLRFYGERDRVKVDEFINAVTAFKQIEQIPDEDALFGLPLLLKDAASSWWAEVRADVNSWKEALDRIRSQFAPTPPPHEIYMQIFDSPQGGNQVIDEFLMEKRQWLGMLPAGRHSEEVQLDLIYGLLTLELRKEISRNDVKTFEELAVKARRIESLKGTAKLTKSIQPLITKKPRKRCTFCRLKGHTSDVCNKKMAKLAVAELENKKILASAPSTESVDSPVELCKSRMGRKVEAALRTAVVAPLMIKVDSPASPTSSAVFTADSPLSPVADSPMSPTAANSPLPQLPMSPPLPNSLLPRPPIADSPMSPTLADSPMSPTSTDDEEPSIYCFGCGAPNVWKSICSKCRNA